MKKTFSINCSLSGKTKGRGLLFISLLLNLFSIAQAPPEGINYQAIARDTAGKAISSSVALDVKFTIWSAPAGGLNLFSEIHSPVSTNSYGLFTLVIGSTDPTGFSAIPWALGDKFLEVEIGIVGGSGYTSMGRTQMMSVPYALHSKTTDLAFGDWSLQGNSISPTDFIGTTALQDLVLKTNNIERMRVMKNGKIGIGTSAPTSALTVSDSGAAAGIGIQNTSPGGTEWKMESNNVGKLKIKKNQGLIFTAVTIDSSGNTGIGTSNPSALFSVGSASDFQVNSAGTIAAATGITSSGAINFSGLSTNGIVRTTGGTGTLSSSSSSVDLTSEVVNTLPIANGGTGLSSLGNWKAFYTDGLGVLTPFSLGAAGSYFQSNGAAMAPSWVSPFSSMSNLTQGTGISAFSYNGSAPATVSIANTAVSAGTYSAIISGQALTIPGFTVNSQGQLTGESSTVLSVEVPLTFNNGLTRTINTIQLGGALNQHTIITAGSFNTLFDLNGTGNFSINKNGGASAFFVNPVSGNVGIGTALPSSPVTIQTLNGNEIEFLSSGSNADIAANAQLNIGSTSSSVNLLTNNTYRVSIDPAGNVGIGTTSPLEKLHVIGNTRISSLSGTGTRMVQTDLNGTLIPLTAGTASQVLLGTGVWGNVPTNTAWSITGNAGTTAASDFLGTTDNISLRFRTNNTQMMIIDSLGNVGIGIRTPASKLHSAGQISTGIPSGGLGGAPATTGSLLFYNSSNSNTINITSNISSTSYTLILPVAQGAASTVLTNDGAGVLSWASGAAPSWSLTGNTATTPSTSAIGTAIGAGQNYVGTRDTKDFVIGTNNFERMRISSGGNVGIGTSSPNINSYGNSGGLLTIQNIPSTTFQGVIELANRTDADMQPIGDVAFSASSQTGAVNKRSALIRGSLSGNSSNANNRGSILQFFTRSDGGSNDIAERLRIDNNGNVGIGTATPASNLHVYKSVAAAADVQNILTLSRVPTSGLNSSAGEGVGINFQSMNNGSVTDITRITSVLTAQGTNPFSAITFSALNNTNVLSEVMRVQGGNVGIGTTMPGTNARLAIKDGHLQSQQTTAPTIGPVTTYNSGSQTLSNATDVAGNISIMPTAFAGSVTINFNKNYSVSPIVILTATNNFSASDMTKVWVTVSPSGFTVNFSDSGGVFPPTASLHTYSYHVIETQ